MIAEAIPYYSLKVPTVFIEDGYRFFFYSADGIEPMHVHVEKAGNTAKFWMQPIRLAASHGLRSHELTRARRLLDKNANLAEEKWSEFFNA